jgi:predicted transglutaminase-like cysteine proteinase
MLAALSWAGAASPVMAGQTFAGYEELALRTGANFPKWQVVRAQIGEEAHAVERCLLSGDCSAPAAADIAGGIKDLREASALEQAEAVHWLVNARPYREDRRQFGRNDVWQTPFSFWKQGGDCEDYAIAKYMALRALGFSDDQLRLTVMTSRMRGEVHAVLLIRIGEAWYVADNLRRSLRPLEQYRGWRPVFSVSDAGAWRYVARPLPDPQEVANAAPASDPEPAARRAGESAPNRERL